MPKGGARKGAGRPPGTTNKKLLTADKDASKEALPLDYMLLVMRDPLAAVTRRDDMARAAAPYLHSKRSTIEVAGDPTAPVRFIIEGLGPTIAAAVTLPEGAK